MEKRLLRLDTVESRIGLKKTKIYDMVKDGTFPRPIKMGGVNVWPEREVCAWIAERIAEREAA